MDELGHSESVLVGKAPVANFTCLDEFTNGRYLFLDGNCVLALAGSLVAELPETWCVSLRPVQLIQVQIRGLHANSRRQQLRITGLLHPPCARTGKHVLKRTRKEGWKGHHLQAFQRGIAGFKDLIAGEVRSMALRIADFCAQNFSSIFN